MEKGEEKEGVKEEKEGVVLTYWNVPLEAEGPLVGWSDAMQQNVPPMFSVYVTQTEKEAAGQGRPPTQVENIT